MTRTVFLILVGILACSCQDVPPPHLNSRPSGQTVAGNITLPHRHAEDRPYGVAVLSSLDEAETVHVLGLLHQGLTATGWLPPPSPGFAMVSSLDQEKEYWTDMAKDPAACLVMVAGNLALLDPVLPQAERWWKALASGTYGIDAVLLLGHDALLSYRYQELPLTIPVFQYSPVQAETWFLADSFPPTRKCLALSPGNDLPRDLGDFAAFLEDGPVQVVGDFDPLENSALQGFFQSVSPLAGTRVQVAGPAWLESSPEAPDKRLFLTKPLLKGVMVTTRLPEDLETRLIDLVRSADIALFCAAGIDGRLKEAADVWRLESPEDEQGKLMALRLAGWASGQGYRGLPSGSEPGLGLSTKLHGVLRVPARYLLGMTFGETRP